MTDAAIPVQVEPIAVVIPCYNQGRFLTDAIESVLQQVHPASEIVVVDDGSTDDTAAVAARYPDVRCIRQRNQGVAAARNAGLRQTTGTYVVFLDADDRLLPNALVAGARHLRDHAVCGFVYGHVRLIAEDGSPRPSPVEACVEQDRYLALLRGNFIWTPGAVMYRRRVFQSTGPFNGAFTGCQDYELNVRIARHFEICCHGEVILEYREHGANMSADPLLMLQSAVAVWQLQWRYVKGSRAHEEAVRAAIEDVRADYGERLVERVRLDLRQHQWSNALRGILILLQYYPRGARKVFG